MNSERQVRLPIMYEAKKLNPLSQNRYDHGKLLPLIRVKKDSIIASEHNKSNSHCENYDLSNNVFVGEKLRFSKKYLKGDISSGIKTRRIRNHVMSILSSNNSTEKILDSVSQQESYKEYIASTLTTNTKRETEPAKLGIKLFRDYVDFVEPAYKNHIKHEHPYFIINSRKHGDFLSDQNFMNNMFNKNITKLAQKFKKINYINKL
jgi:hypothetical protein